MFLLLYLVDVMPASIDDAFIASDWRELCNEHLPGQNIHAVLKENVIDKLKSDYDFILVDSGPHLDAFLKNALASANILFTPLPPATVDFHSSLKYVARLPELVKLISDEGCECQLATNIGFMSKLSNKADHKYCHSPLKKCSVGICLMLSSLALTVLNAAASLLTLLFQLTRQRMLVVLMH